MTQPDACLVDGHQLQHIDHPDTGERVICVREDGCQLDVPRPPAAVCMHGAYAVWETGRPHA